MHFGTRFHVYLFGFWPGFPYMGDLPPKLALPRRADPRLRVPAGSISIATSLTAIYPYESPGGWHLIGVLLDPDVSTPSAPNLRFSHPATPSAFSRSKAAAFASIRRAVETRSYEVESAPVAL